MRSKTEPKADHISVPSNSDKARNLADASVHQKLALFTADRSWGAGPAAANQLGACPILRRAERVDERLDVAVAIGEGDAGGVAAVDLRHVVRHQHVGIADIAIEGEGARHVHVALVGKGLHEIELPPPDVAQMHVEDLLPPAEPADYVENLAGGVVEHFGDRALAEIEPVIGAFVHLHE